MPELITRREGAVGWIVFSNVAKHNAMTFDMWRALPDAIDAFEADNAVRAIVLTGDGEKAFISGADISQFEKVRGTKDAQAEYNAAVERAYQAPAKCAKPVIARIRGICMGGGLGLASACDVRFASEDATFRMPAARLGLGYGYIGLKRFVDLMGPAHAADMFISARKFGADDALRMGFVNRVLPLADFDREVGAYAAMVAENAPLTVAAAKRTIAEILKDPQSRDLGALKAMVEGCFGSEDYTEGRTAFMEKRKPAFKGR